MTLQILWLKAARLKAVTLRLHLGSLGREGIVRMIAILQKKMILLIMVGFRIRGVREAELPSEACLSKRVIQTGLACRSTLMRPRLGQDAHRLQLWRLIKFWSWGRRTWET